MSSSSLTGNHLYSCQHPPVCIDFLGAVLGVAIVGTVVNTTLLYVYLLPLVNK